MRKQERRKLNKETRFFLGILPPYTSAYFIHKKEWVQSMWIKHPERHRRMTVIYGISLKTDENKHKLKTNSVILKKGEFENQFGGPLNIRGLWPTDFIDPL